MFSWSMLGLMVGLGSALRLRLAVHFEHGAQQAPNTSSDGRQDLQDEQTSELILFIVQRSERDLPRLRFFYSGKLHIRQCKYVHLVLDRANRLTRRCKS